MGNIKKSILIIILTILINVIFITGCNSNINNNTIESENTKVVVDSIGREVTIPIEVKTVATLYAYTGHVTTLLGQEDKIIGIVNGLRKDMLMREKIEDIDDISIPFVSGSINIEELIKIKPDVIFVRNSTASNKGEVEKLKKANIPYLVIDYKNIKEQKKSIEILGEVFNKQDKANEYIKFYEETINMVQNRLSSLKSEDKKRVYHSVNAAVRTDSKGSIQDEITDLAGVINVSVGSNLIVSKDETNATLEQIYSWKPEAIIANEYDTINYILNDKKWEGLEAVKNEEIYTLPVGISRWAHPGSIETPMAVLYIANLFYPEYFEDIDMIQFIKDYYKKNFDLELTNKDIEQILSGKGMRLQK
ncbi:ABC transporter substrate-binding protein [Romboutsia sp.]|uniref:ABC transporter substrate-binding protein n=1 Tax=Romboutsia sp. TaxID=1965302 RepID=UPI002C446990|nr:ABC transporter substrate-binding protein [Romboutsia sp.]HSQ90052.1 ABC transporter substrate-binding protein [Romboutsia sp.]